MPTFQRKWLPVSAIVILLCASAWNTGYAQEPRAGVPTGVRRVADLTYVQREAGPLRLDLYLPAKAPDTPLSVLVWIHGGGWKAGSKDRCPFAWLAAEGYAVASIQYRLIPGARWPAQFDDCRDAVRWLREHAGEYRLDPRSVAVAGGSAGGHLAALLGTADSPSDEKTSSRVQAVIDLYGPADLLTMPNNLPAAGKSDDDLAKTNGAILLGGIVRDRPELAKQASALHQVSRGDAAFLILHGDQDRSVPLDQSERLHARLREAGVVTSLHVVKGAGHGGAAFQDAERRALVRAFLKEHLRSRE